MSKVFEALQRQQQTSPAEAARDPLAAETGTPDHPPATETGDFELPQVIGAPVSARSNEGALFPALTQTEEPAPSLHPAAPIGNGKRLSDRARPAPTATRRAAPLRAAPAVAHGEEAAYTPPVEKVELARVHPRLIVLTEPQAPAAEQYRTLRTQLFHAAERQPIQVIILTSAVAAEGKTSTALNLALAIAQSREKRVLIIDGDLRHSTVASYLGLRARPGLEAVLNGQGEWLERIFCLDEPELCVLPVNPEVANPTELLSSERLPELLHQLREQFDFIIVDSPPLVPFADARLLANHADAVIVVVRAELATYETVTKAIGLLPAERILGVVLNGVPQLEETGYYDYYYNHSHRAPRRSLWDRLTRRFRAERADRM